MSVITISTANICGNPLRPKRAVRARMRLALSLPGVVFGQEVARSNRWRRGGNYSALWHAVASRHRKATFGGSSEVPISVPADWEVLGSESVHVHGGLRAISPARLIQVVKTQPGPRVAFVDCHPVSKPRKGVTRSAWRIQKWDLYIDRLRTVVADLHAEGYTVIVGGDMNKAKVPQIHRAQVVLTESGLDHLWAVPAEGASVRVLRRSRIARTVLMDHPILTVTVEVTQ